MARDGLLPPWAAKISANRRVPYITTIVTGAFVALWALIGDANETYNLTNIGTLFAFALVSAGVLVLALIPNRAALGRSSCVGMGGRAVSVVAVRLRDVRVALETWIRFAVWLAIGLALYVGVRIQTQQIRNREPRAGSGTLH